MLPYIIRRLLLVIPTLFGIMVLNFVIVQFAPGGPVEQIMSRLEGTGVSATARFGGSAGSEVAGGEQGTGEGGTYRGRQGLRPELVAQLNKQFGFDEPAPQRFVKMMGNYLTFNFGNSFFKDRSVVELVIERLPVSISLGVWTTLLVYLVSIPLGISKAVRDGSRFDVWTSGAVILGNAIPSFLFAIMLIVVFAGGRYLDWFPLRDLTSPNWSDLSWPDRIVDYLWHIVLPVSAMVISGFASLTMLTKNSFLDQIRQQYVITARAKGLTNRGVLYGHVFRNGMLIVIAAFPSAFVGMLFTGALLIETIFSLNGMGLLSFEAVVQRDYPVIFGTLYFFTLLGLIMGIVGDVTYMLVDPRIDFESREV
jgi:microcin C transport system permease protein